MRTQFSKFAFTAGISLALVFTFGCSSDDGGGSSNIKYGSFVYGGKTYKTVEIGKQVWMAENLNYFVEDSKCYDNDQSNCATYGRLYDWATAMALSTSCNTSSCSVGKKHKGICPNRWHIPSDAEWTTLTKYVGSSTAGTKLKITSGWNGQDTYGFSALPGGYGSSYDGFFSIGIRGDWWSATESIGRSNAYRRSINTSSSVSRNSSDKDYFLSVRCVQD